MRSPVFPFLAFAAFFLGSSKAEIQPLNSLLSPDESTIHYYEGYIRAPGSIDLSDLTFSVKNDNFWNDDAVAADTDDEYTADTGDNDGSGGRRRFLEDTVDLGGTELDIVVFMLPESCANKGNGCDYTELGVGARSENNTLRWCCTNDAIQMGMCERDDTSYGRLIIDKDNYSGDSRHVHIQPNGDVSKQLRHGNLQQMTNGHYVVIMANCNPTGRPVKVSGMMVWLSEHGYLPGELFGIMHFYIFLLAVYFCMTLWYGVSIIINRDSSIPIEKWILGTILLGLLEMAFQTYNFIFWNTEGYQYRMYAYLAIVTGSLKQGLSRCLAVMVGLGWGVIRDSLGYTMRIIVLLGTVYVAVSVLVDMLVVFAIEDMQQMTDQEEDNIFDVASVLTFVLAVLDVVFFMWMLDALNNTMEYLENMNQLRKLKRYLQLRTLFLFTILAAVFWAIFSLVDTYDETGILLEENEWVIEALKETIFVCALLGVAILWRPHPNAKEYAYVMELPALGADGENELELTGVVPSAMDLEDDDDVGDDEDFESPTGRKPRNGFGDAEFS